MEQKKKILLTAFCGTSSKTLIQDVEDCQVLMLPNDKVRDSQILIEAIDKEHFDYVISLGQRPNIKDRVHIETMARNGENQIGTSFDYEQLRQLFEQNGIVVKLSHNAGTSFCNELYWNGLKYISEHRLETRMVFVHVPYLKNIKDFEGFKRLFIRILTMELKNCIF